MERKLITCPGSAHLEEIEMERTPLGILIGSCTRFSPACAVTCARDCAARMDRRDRMLSPDRRERVLLVYADDHERQLTERLAHHLGDDDLAVEMADAQTYRVPPPQDYSTVVVVAPVHRRRLARSTADYVSKHRDALAEISSVFVPISTRTDDDLPAGEAVAAVASATGWAPSYSEAIAVHARAAATLDQRIRALARKIADVIPKLCDTAT
jgi:menaquinone-dependent protoporphyrinogen IX oxidase